MILSCYLKKGLARLAQSPITDCTIHFAETTNSSLDSTFPWSSLLRAGGRKDRAGIDAAGKTMTAPTVNKEEVILRGRQQLPAFEHSLAWHRGNGSFLRVPCDLEQQVVPFIFFLTWIPMCKNKQIDNNCPRYLGLRRGKHPRQRMHRKVFLKSAKRCQV